MSSVETGQAELGAAVLSPSAKLVRLLRDRSLAARTPDLSAAQRVDRRQAIVLGGCVAALLLGLILRPLQTLITINALVTALYCAIVLSLVLAARQLTRGRRTIWISDQEASALSSDELPKYAVLMPAYRESDVIQRAIAAVLRIDYPSDRLDVRVLLEEDDEKTRAAVAELSLPLHVQVVMVPVVAPRTKPKALMYILPLLDAEFVTLYDAEDEPEPLQLRRAVRAFRSASSEVGCLQAILRFRNSGQNLLTHWMAIDYTVWFRAVMPVMARIGLPLPLGGTSMHIRLSALSEVGAWDAYNVTEDADLGIRLARFGYRTAILESDTEEEATSRVWNWVRQRTRWYKGYLQTFLVHARHPRMLAQQIGWLPALGILLLVGSTPLLPLLNPLLWSLTWLWFTLKEAFIAAIFPGWLYYPALISLVVGNFLVVYVALLSGRVYGLARLLPAIVLLPVYWLLHVIAAYRAIWQLIWDPLRWEKTEHGHDRGR